MKLSSCAVLAISLLLFAVLLHDVTGQSRYFRFGRSFQHTPRNIARARAMAEDNGKWQEPAQVNRNIDERYSYFT